MRILARIDQVTFKITEGYPQAVGIGSATYHEQSLLSAQEAETTRTCFSYEEESLQ
jgi:hypothetical protein